MDEQRAPEETALSPVCRAFLVKLGRTPDKTKRRTVLAACARVRRPWSEELLWEALADPNESVRDFVARELRDRPTLRVDLARRRLGNPPWYARSTALAVIGGRRVREALPEVGQACCDANAEVRRAAADALGEIGGEEALRHLVRLRKDVSPYVRAAAEAAIEKTSGVRFS